MGVLARLFGGRPQVQPTHVETLANFRSEVLKSDQPVIVNIWSQTCAPCKRQAPVLVEIATRYSGQVKVVEIGTTAEGALLAHLKVQATPTTIIYDGGEELGRITGFRPRSWFEEMIAAELVEEGAAG